MKYLLDTHAWIWANMEPSRLSARTRGILESGDYEELLLSAISPWEFCKLIEKGRLIISMDPQAWIQEALDMANLRLVPLLPVIAYKSTTLAQPFHDDPADQIIVATAQQEGAMIITKDERIRKYRYVKNIW